MAYHTYIQQCVAYMYHRHRILNTDQCLWVCMNIYCNSCLTLFPVYRNFGIHTKHLSMNWPMYCNSYLMSQLPNPYSPLHVLTGGPVPWVSDQVWQREYCWSHTEGCATLPWGQRVWPWFHTKQISCCCRYEATISWIHTAVLGSATCCHPSMADEVWYWLKHILLSGWL